MVAVAWRRCLTVSSDAGLTFVYRVQTTGRVFGVFVLFPYSNVLSQHAYSYTQRSLERLIMIQPYNIVFTVIFDSSHLKYSVQVRQLSRFTSLPLMPSSPPSCPFVARLPAPALLPSGSRVLQVLFQVLSPSLSRSRSAYLSLDFRELFTSL